MKLVVGLGNPGRKYDGTRHNVGFDILAELARASGGGTAKASFDGEVVDANLSGQRAILLWPHTFMNRSGTSVVKARDFYKLANEELLIVCDDFHLALGQIRFRAKGSAGGQRGLEDIIRALGTEEFSRLRVGVGEPPENRDAADYVLGKFSKQERTEIDIVIREAADAIVHWARNGIQSAMNQFN
jgi:PTH1 family peptidyl-tRNA hydrolase